MAARILHLIHGFGGGGAERQLSYVAPSLANMGLEIHVAHVTEGVNFSRIDNSACTLHRLAASGNHDPRLFLSILGLLRKLRPSLLQTWLLQMDLLGGCAALTYRVPFILSERNSGIAYEA